MTSRLPRSPIKDRSSAASRSAPRPDSATVLIPRRNGRRIPMSLPPPNSPSRTTTTRTILLYRAQTCSTKRAGRWARSLGRGTGRSFASPSDHRAAGETVRFQHTVAIPRKPVHRLAPFPRLLGWAAHANDGAFSRPRPDHRLPTPTSTTPWLLPSATLYCSSP